VKKQTVAILAIITVSSLAILMLSNPSYAQTSIPSWIKNNAKMWSEGQITDSEFVQGIKYLIENKIMVIEQNKMQDKGDFKLEYIPVADSNYTQYEEMIKNSGLYEQYADGLNKMFVLPTDVTITWKECGVPNAFYDHDSKHLIMCYELVKYFRDTFYNESQSDQELVNKTLGATTFTFIHELGHGLIDVYNLPATGKEEDAVDQLSTIVLLYAGPNGKQAIEAAASWFYISGSKANLEEMPFWDEHSFDTQRFYEIACLTYGKDPQENSFMVDQQILPESRAVKCPAEYEKINRAWTTLLEPYVKEDYR